MACKFTVNSAIQARLLRQPRFLQPSRQIAMPCQVRSPPILRSRSYSESTPAPPLPKDSGSAKGSQLSKREDKNRFPLISTWSKVWARVLVIGGIGIVVYVTQELWLPDWYKERRRRIHESAREFAIHDKLRKGPEFRVVIKNIIARKAVTDEVRTLITPTSEPLSYPFLIGEHGTGKTSLIMLAVKDLKEPKGVIYVDVPVVNESPIDLAEAIQQALGCKSDPVIDSNKSLSLKEVWETFSHAAIKYEQEYKKIPVLIIDNANRLAEKQLEQIQDYAKRATDQGTATVVFVSSESHVPRHMIERSSWSRHGEIVEISDVSKDEALQYLTLQKIDNEQAAQIYELVGGRMIHLKQVADEIQRNRALQCRYVREQMFYDAESELKIAEILPEYRYHKEGEAVVHELLKKGSISDLTYFELAERIIGEKLLDANVFAFHINSRQITFQSTLMKRFCEQESVRWEQARQRHNIKG